MGKVITTSEKDQIEENFETIARLIGQTYNLMSDAGYSHDLIELTRAAHRNTTRIGRMVEQNPYMKVK